MPVLRSLLIALLCLAPGLTAAAPPAQGVSVEGAKVREVPPGQVNSAAFMTVRNAGPGDRALVGAESDIAEAVELHSHIHDGGMMRMRRIDRIDIPAGTQTRLEPGGLHIMLIGLNRRLRGGDEVELTLVFADGSRFPVRAPVQPIDVGHDHEHGP